MPIRAKSTGGVARDATAGRAPRHRGRRADPPIPPRPRIRARRGAHPAVRGEVGTPRPGFEGVDLDPGSARAGDSEGPIAGRSPSRDLEAAGLGLGSESNGVADLIGGRRWCPKLLARRTRSATPARSRRGRLAPLPSLARGPHRPEPAAPALPAGSPPRAVRRLRVGRHPAVSTRPGRRRSLAAATTLRPVRLTAGVEGGSGPARRSGSSTIRHRSFAGPTFSRSLPEWRPEADPRSSGRPPGPRGGRHPVPTPRAFRLVGLKSLMRFVGDPSARSGEVGSRSGRTSSALGAPVGRGSGPQPIPEPAKKWISP